MGQIISGAELGAYKTTAIQLGIAKKENRNGVKSKYVLLTLQDVKSRLARPVRRVIFDDQLPGLHEMLAKYAATTQDAQGMFPVDIKAFKNSEDFEEWQDLMLFPGGTVLTYNLRKGECYANDVNGNRVLNKDNEPVKKKQISVFVQISQIIPDGDKMRTIYVNGLSLEEEGQRMEDRFYKEPVIKNEADVDPLSAIMPPAQAQAAPEAPVQAAPETSARPF